MDMAARIAFQRSIGVKLVNFVFLVSYCGYSYPLTKLDLLGFPQELNAPVIPNVSIRQPNDSTLRADFGNFYHLNKITVNRSTSGFLQFYISYTEVKNEPALVLKIQDSVWPFESISLRTNFALPILLTPMSLTIHVAKGSLKPDEVTFIGTPVQSCPPGFEPRGDATCLHLSATKALQASARRLCRSYTWAGGRGELFSPKQLAMNSYFTGLKPYKMHVGIEKQSGASSSGWQWQDTGEPVPMSHWKLGQPSEVYGLWSTDDAGLVAALPDTKQMFGCSLPQAVHQDGNIRTLQSGHVTFATYTESYGSIGSVCLLHPNSDTSRAKNATNNRLFLMDEKYSKFSTTRFTRKNTLETFACAAPVDTLDGRFNAENVHLTIVTVEEGCYEPLLPQSHGLEKPNTVSVTGHPFASSFFDASEAIVGNSIRMPGNCILAMRDKENYVYSVNVTHDGYACEEKDSKHKVRKYRNFCRIPSVLVSFKPVCATRTNLLQTCLPNNCLHNYEPWLTGTYLSHNLVLFKTMYFNDKHLEPSPTGNGFIRVNTRPLASTVPPAELHRLLVDLKSPHFINGVDFIASIELHAISFLYQN